METTLSERSQAVNDLSPSEYALIESVESGWHRLRDLPVGTRFRSTPLHSSEWSVQPDHDNAPGVPIRCLGGVSLASGYQDVRVNGSLWVWVA